MVDFLSGVNSGSRDGFYVGILVPECHRAIAEWVWWTPDLVEWVPRCNLNSGSWDGSRVAILAPGGIPCMDSGYRGARGYCRVCVVNSHLEMMGPEYEFWLPGWIPLVISGWWEPITEWVWSTPASREWVPFCNSGSWDGSRV